MRHRSIRTAWLILLALLAFSAAGVAQWGGSGPWAGAAMDLSEEQWAKIEKLRSAYWEKTSPLRVRWREAAWALDDLAWEGAAEKELEAARKALEALENELEAADRAHRDEVRSVLNDEQKALFDRYGGLGMGCGRWSYPGRGTLRGRGYGYGGGMRWGSRPARGPGWGGGAQGGRAWKAWRGRFCPYFRWR